MPSFPKLRTAGKIYIYAGCMEKLTQYETIEKFKIDTILQEGGKPEPLGGC